MKIASIIVGFLFVFVISTHLVFAQESTSSADISPTPAFAEYQLPYHGILPDSKFYFFRTLRDRIVSLLIATPIKKVEFDLLQADKKVSAGVALVSKGKLDLAESTISKGMNYFEDAIANVQEADKQGINTKNVIDRMYLASGKHVLVLTLLEGKVVKEKKLEFGVLRKRAEKHNNVVGSLLK